MTVIESKQHEHNQKTVILDEFIGLLLMEGREKVVAQFIGKVLDNNPLGINKCIRKEFAEWYEIEINDDNIDKIEPILTLEKEDVPLDLVLWHSDWLVKNNCTRRALYANKNVFGTFKTDRQCGKAKKQPFNRNLRRK